jgi:hypothetical protein
VGINGGAKSSALHAPAGKTCRDRRQRLAVRIELGGITLPERVLRLPSDSEVVTNPKIALAIEHRLAARTVPTAIELER